MKRLLIFYEDEGCLEIIPLPVEFPLKWKKFTFKRYKVLYEPLTPTKNISWIMSLLDVTCSVNSNFFYFFANSSATIHSTTLWHFVNDVLFGFLMNIISGHYPIVSDDRAKKNVKN